MPPKRSLSVQESARDQKTSKTNNKVEPSSTQKYRIEAVLALFPGYDAASGPPIRDGPAGSFKFRAASTASAEDKRLVSQFLPNRSPEEVLRAGAFGGTYFRNINSGVVKQTLKNQWQELPPSWIEGLDPKIYLARPWSSYDESLNKFGHKSGTTLEDWESSGWITAHDPFGWFQWYCRFFQGRRCDDDARQIGRWLKCCGPTGRWKGNLCGKVVVSGSSFDDPFVSPVVRQTLLHWGYELTLTDFEASLKRMGKGSGAYLMNKDQINSALASSSQGKPKRK